ncbi:MAG: Resolvase domain [Streptosporangiaceae bacterium]|nr:Resolvase domain [Streptosporangiaceae bacterium]
MRTIEGARLGIYTRASDDQQDTQTSVTAQAGFGDRWGLKHGCTVADDAHYCDNDKSASWYATKPRADFERLLADIAAGKLDLVWFWQVSRSQRDLGVYVKLRDLCRAQGVGWVIKSRPFDLNDPSDLRSLGMDAVNAEVASVEISEVVRMGMGLAAQLGKPHGPTTYGYVRRYDERGRYVEQVPQEPQAEVVRELIRRISKGEPVARLCRELEQRAVPAPLGGPKWSRAVVRNMASNLAYLGIRVHEPKEGERTETPGCWAPLVSEETFYAAQTVLNSPGRSTTKPGRGIHLLSYLARCQCGAQLGTKVVAGRRQYACIKYCAAVGADELDDFVRKVVDGYLARKDVREFLAAVHADDSETVQARGDVARLRNELEENRKAREAGHLDLAEFIRFKEALSTRIADAEARAEQASIPPVLRAGAVDWDDIAVSRQVVGHLADVRIKPAGKGRKVPVWERVTWTWLIGPDANLCSTSSE